VAGLSPPSARSCRSFDPSLPKLADFAAATNINLAWLVTGRGPLDTRQAVRHALLEEYLATEFEPAGTKAGKAPLAFHELWLFELFYGPAAAPKQLGATATMSPPLLMKAGEDSIEPTIAKGDLLLIDRSFGPTPSERRQAQRQRCRRVRMNCGGQAYQALPHENHPTNNFAFEQILPFRFVPVVIGAIRKPL
jgi:hypothetical protein